MRTTVRRALLEVYYVNILIDNLSVTWHYDNVCDLYEQLGLCDVVTHSMRARYYSYGDYYDGVLIAYNTDDLGNVTDTFLDISGKGCRTVEQVNNLKFDWFDFLHRYDTDIRERRCHISRIDIACDLTDNELPIDILYKYTRNLMYVCRSKVLPDVRDMRTEEIYFGSPRSDRLLRIYNKALEQGIPDTYWLRMEFQLRNDNAVSWYLNWCEHRDVGRLYTGVMMDFLRFVQVPKGADIEEIKNNRNQGRLPTAVWWDKLLGEAERIPQMYLPGEEYTLARLERYLEKQSYSSLKTYIIAHDGDLTKLLDGIKHVNLNHKQKQLIDQLKLKTITNPITKSDLGN